METLLKTICDSAFIAKDSNNLNIIGLFENIETKFFPAVHPKMAFVWSIKGEPNKEITYYFNIQDPKGNIVVDKKNEQAKGTMGPNGKINLIINFIGFQITQEGTYTVNLFADNFKDSLKFNARLISQA